MKVKAKHQFRHKGLQFEKGHVMDLPDNEAHDLVQAGHVEAHTDDPKSAAKPPQYGGGQTGENQH